MLAEAKRVDREITYNPFDLFFKRKIVPGRFVTVGYVKDADEESPKITGRKTNIIENDDEFRDFVLNKYADTMWAQDFANILDMPDYNKALSGKAKTATFNIEGHVVRIQKFIYNWREPENLAKKFAGKEEEIARARANAGFGQGVNSYEDEEDFFDDTDDSYDEEDWRRKPQYMGTGVRQRGLKKNSSSGYRFATPAPGLYSYSGTDPDKYNKMAVRNMIDKRVSTKSGYKSVYYYVAPTGEMEEMPFEFISFIRNNYKGTRNVTPKAAEQMTPDEAEFNAVIDAIEKKYANMQQPTDLIFDNILYITAAPIDWNAKDGKGTPMVFVNNRAVYKEFPYLKPRYVNPVIAEFCTSFKDKSGAYNNSIEVVTEKQKMNKKNQALYETIMRHVSKTVKQKLNEMA